ncbi:MAG: hypothetical protein ACT4PT_07715 [Methanobacteriota archaeon]
MMRVPSFMLRRLYVKSSLESFNGGFEFKLQNTLATATLVAPPQVTLNGEVVSARRIVLEIDDETVKAEHVTATRPLLFPKNAVIRVQVERTRMPASPVSLGVATHTREWGILQFEVEDNLA